MPSLDIILGIVRKFWWSIPMALLLAALMITRHTLASRTADFHACEKDRAALTEKLATTQASLDGALGQINDNNRRIEAANAALEQSKQQAAADVAAANAHWEAQKGAVTALEASARDKAQPPCTVSQRALKEIQGL